MMLIVLLLLLFTLWLVFRHGKLWLSRDNHNFPCLLERRRRELVLRNLAGFQIHGCRVGIDAGCQQFSFNTALLSGRGRGDTCPCVATRDAGLDFACGVE